METELLNIESVSSEQKAAALTAGMAQREPQIRASFPAPENSQPDSDVDWDFLGE